MKTLVDFFVLRPAFTLYGLRIIWFLFLLSLALQYLALGVGTYAAHGPRMFEFWLEFMPSVLSNAVYIALVRLLLEVAAIILLHRGPIPTGEN